MSIEISTQGAVRVLRLTRPDKLNALTRDMLEGLRAAMEDVCKTPSVRAVLLTSSGRAFSVGADLNDPMMGRGLPPEEAQALTAEVLGGLMNGVIRDLAECPVPVVTAVNGIAAGGAVGLSLAGDVTLASESAVFKLGFVPQLGLVPDLGATWQLVRRLGRARARGYALLGTDLPAADAVSHGLIWATAPDDALEAEAMAVAERLAAGPSEGQRVTRGLLDLAETADLATSLAAEAQAQAQCATSLEVDEGIRAFTERRAPDFTKIPRR